MKYETQSELINKSFCTLRCSFTWHVLKRQLQHTLTGRFTPRPHSCGMTCTSTVSYQVVACITTVGGCLSKGCSSSVTNLAIGWLSQSATVHVCQKKRYIFIMFLYQEMLGKLIAILLIGQTEPQISNLSIYFWCHKNFYILLTTKPGIVVPHR